MPHRLSPISLALYRDLRDRILRGDYPAGRALPPERELTEEFGVSRLVVRNVVSALAREGLIEVKPRCRPVIARRRPTSEESRHLTVWLWPNASEYGVSLILRGIHRALARTPIKLVFGNPAQDSDWSSTVLSERSFLEGLANDPGLAGLILWYIGGERNLDALRELQNQNLPMVFVDRPAPSFDGDHVGTDNQRAAREVVRYLVRLGHRRIACLVNMDDAITVKDRVVGYEAALEEAGIERRADFIRTCNIEGLEDVRDAVARQLRELSALPDAPTAYFCINDSLALMAHDVLESWGMSIPRDISLVGFDGMLRWLPDGGYITTAAQDFERMGELAARLILERIESGTPPRVFRHYLLDAPLSLHGSAGAPPQPSPPTESETALRSTRTQ